MCLCVCEGHLGVSIAVQREHRGFPPSNFWKGERGRARGRERDRDKEKGSKGEREKLGDRKREVECEWNGVERARDGMEGYIL